MASSDEVSLREHLEGAIRNVHNSIGTRFDHIQSYIDLRFRTIEKETTLARESMEHRLDTMNEFRAQLKDQSSQFVLRTECDKNEDRAGKDIRDLQLAKATAEGKASQGQWLLTLILALAALVVGVINLIK